jgi:hypothetical protein
LSLIQDLLDTIDAANQDATLNAAPGVTPKLITWFVAEYAETAVEPLKEMARAKISEELVNIHTSLIETIADADERMKTAIDEAVAESSSKKQQDAVKKRNAAVKRNLMNASDRLTSAIQSAILFDEQGNLKDLFKALRQAIAAETLAYNAIVGK